MKSRVVSRWAQDVPSASRLFRLCVTSIETELIDMPERKFRIIHVNPVFGNLLREMTWLQCIDRVTATAIWPSTIKHYSATTCRTGSARPLHPSRRTIGASRSHSRTARVGAYDLVVGADGIRSTVRAMTLGTTPPPTYLGAMNWRSIVPIRPAGLEKPLNAPPCRRANLIE
jgi:2-polyprenyl-6-methoxyphenol hydroxylase-like FAD-dependent oxidoreductase